MEFWETTWRSGLIPSPSEKESPPFYNELDGSISSFPSSCWPFIRAPSSRSYSFTNSLYTPLSKSALLFYSYIRFFSRHFVLNLITRLGAIRSVTSFGHINGGSSFLTSLIWFPWSINIDFTELKGAKMKDFSSWFCKLGSSSPIRVSKLCSVKRIYSDSRCICDVGVIRPTLPDAVLL